MGNGTTRFIWHRAKLIRAGLLAFATLAMAGAAAAKCSDTSVTLRGDWGQARFSVEIADDAGERAQGLMHRTSLAGSAVCSLSMKNRSRLAFGCVTH